jgi:hypothetical protein
MARELPYENRLQAPVLLHHDEWLAYAQEEDPDPRMEDLIIIPACDRYRAWTIAVFDDECVWATLC